MNDSAISTNKSSNADFAVDRLRVLFQQESSHYRTVDYMKRLEVEQQWDLVNVTPGREVEGNEHKETARWYDAALERHHGYSARLFSPVASEEGTASVSVKNKSSSFASSSAPGTEESQERRKQEPCGMLSSPKQERVLDAQYRSGVAKWAMQVADSCGYPRNTVAICMNYFDRYHAQQPSKLSRSWTKDSIQLVMISCLLIAVKITATACHYTRRRDTAREEKGTDEADDLRTMHQCPPPYGAALNVEHMCHMSERKFSPEQIIAMEKELLNALDWYVHPPTAEVFLENYMTLLSSPGTGIFDNLSQVFVRWIREAIYYHFREINDTALYVLDNATLDYYFVGSPPSVVALAALVHAVCKVRPSCFSVNGDDKREEEKGYYSQEFHEYQIGSACALLLGGIHQRVGSRRIIDSPIVIDCCSRVSLLMSPRRSSEKRKRLEEERACSPQSCNISFSLLDPP